MTPKIVEYKSWTLYVWTTAIFQSNVYLVVPKKGDEAFLIDAGGRGKDVVAQLGELNKTLKYIVLTHNHFDHTGAARTIARKTGAKIVMGKADTWRSKDFKEGGKALHDGDELVIGTIKAKVIATPGHSKGGISLLVPEAVFTGDTLFAGGIGRTDLRGGSMKEIMNSIKDKLLALSDDTVVYPGHGHSSTIGRERKTNPFIAGDF